MMKRTPHAHAPALAPQEAVLLPALPRNLVTPVKITAFKPAKIEKVERVEDHQPMRRKGSAAGRAILHAQGVTMPRETAVSCSYVQSAWLQTDRRR